MGHTRYTTQPEPGAETALNESMLFSQLQHAATVHLQDAQCSRSFGIAGAVTKERAGGRM